MKKVLNELELEQVAGGEVRISKDYMNIGFTTLGQKFDLKNCTFKEARDFRDELMEQNPTMSEAQFDAFCKQQFINKGWI